MSLGLSMRCMTHGEVMSSVRLKDISCMKERSESYDLSLHDDVTPI